MYLKATCRAVMVKRTAVLLAILHMGVREILQGIVGTNVIVESPAEIFL
jgi:hypothetical protein